MEGPLAGAVELRSVSKWYGPVLGLNDVSLTIGGGVTGLLGPNGAGKTTLIRLVTGQAQPSLGEVLVHGKDPFRDPDALRRLGCCPDVEAVDEETTPERFLLLFARLHGFVPAAARARVAELLERVGLRDAAARKIGSFSKGMRQRVKLALALMSDPDVLVLDEPLNGLDPVGRREVIALVRSLGAEGRTVLISSHVLHEVEAMTDTVVLMHHGRVLAEGRVHDIRTLLKGYPHHVSLDVDDAHAVARHVMEGGHVVALRFEEGALVVETTDPDRLLRTVSDLVLDDGLTLRRLNARDDSLASVFDYLVR